MRRGDGVKVGCLTTGGLMDVCESRKKGKTRSKACHEESAEAIVLRND
jgi:hypothetical protein